MDRYTFKKWLKLREVSTSTGDVAHYSLPIGGMVGRSFPQFYGVGDHGLAGPLQDLIAPVHKKRRRKHK